MLQELHSSLPFLPKKNEDHKFEKDMFNFYNKKKVPIHIKALKQTMNHGFKREKVQRVTEFNQRLARDERHYFQLMKNLNSGKTVENVWRHQYRDNWHKMTSFSVRNKSSHNKMLRRYFAGNRHGRHKICLDEIEIILKSQQ